MERRGSLCWLLTGSATRKDQNKKASSLCRLNSASDTKGGHGCTKGSTGFCADICLIRDFSFFCWKLWGTDNSIQTEAAQVYAGMQVFAVCMYYAYKYACRHVQNMHIQLSIHDDIFWYGLIDPKWRARSSPWKNFLLEGLWSRVTSCWPFNKRWCQIEISEALNTQPSPFSSQFAFPSQIMQEMRSDKNRLWENIT